ncbi:9640_t:CDS:2 [Funneliformis geosporum]|uniref:5880_t:CDS:1 n=1 Tax=Funneliformis geosporum TaxID=1117311 RepID=A0A9W4WNG2_9GLOM|nr:9640_t:CDS:2 [Funneliformis geosporum]CAI2174641.1 5880_t:CDS:2 [Funneliformis geosporum]
MGTMKQYAGNMSSDPCDAGSLTSSRSSSTTNANSIPSSLIRNGHLERYAAEVIKSTMNDDLQRLELYRIYV